MLRDPYFTYSAGSAGGAITRAEAVEWLASRAGNVSVTLYPGAITAQIRCGRLGPPEVQASGHGFLPASRADRWGRVLIEAAAVAAEAQGS